MVAERDLLFGLLALQNGLIQQAQLVAAFHAWTCDRARPLAEHLVGRGDLDAEQRAGLEAMVVLHLKKHGGDIEKSLAAVSAGKFARDGLAELDDPNIRATLGFSPAQPSTRIDHDDPDRTASFFMNPPTSDGQRFRIVRPHARGGLGAVFVAVDGELHREVALKQILERLADDPFSRQRFIAEAEITGALEHPGIVPVYALGADIRGRPYYAMRFIKGDSLKLTIERFHADQAREASPGRRSLELRELLRRFVDVCNAIEYAHSRGVIHRDIKPANIIVGKHGETLVVDWGLAKSVGRADRSAGEHTITPASSGSSETAPGSALGTPAYMSPEQAAGELDRVGTRSDIYSLGATLYCLLTGKPPFEGDDVGEILLAVRENRFVPPAQLEPALDPALESVCLKAMALQAEDRYASARFLAEDIERWMADEPVTAWREPWQRRLVRWLSRHRTGVTAAAAALLAGLVGLCTVLAVQSTANAQLSASLFRETTANKELAIANQELKSSKAAVQARYDLAVEAIKTFHTGVSEDFLLKEAKFKNLRNQLLQTASEFYGKLGTLLGKQADVASRRALTLANFELAGLTRAVGRPDAALAAHRAVLSAREALALEAGADSGVKADVGRSLAAVADLLLITGKFEDALAAFRRAELILAEPAGSDPAIQSALAACRTDMARLLLDLGKPAEALAACRLARADQEKLAAMPGAPNSAHRDLAETITEIGFHLMKIGKLANAELEFRTALAIYQKLATGNPAVADFQRGLANSHFYLSNTLTLTGKQTLAIAELRSARAITQKLADGNPGVTRFARNLAIHRLYLGDLLSLTGETTEAEAEMRAALAIIKDLADEEPGVPEFGRWLARCHHLLGLLLSKVGRPAESEAEYRAALAILKTLAKANPVVTDFREDMAISHNWLGTLLLHLGRKAESEAEGRTAAAIVQKLVDENPTNSQFRDRLAYCLVWYGDAVRSLGRLVEAKGIYERSVALAEQRLQEEPTNQQTRYTLVCAIRRRGISLRDSGEIAGATAAIRRALRLCDELPEHMDYDFEIACCHAALAGLVARDGSGISAAEGTAAAARAVHWLRRAVATGNRNAFQFRAESALDSIRSRDDFQLLMMEVVFPADPIALGR